MATGGTPIISWLPNQLSTVLRVMNKVSKNIKTDTLKTEERELVDLIVLRAKDELEALEKQIADLKKERGE